jgi:hypothetical protein
MTFSYQQMTAAVVDAARQGIESERASAAVRINRMLETAVDLKEDPALVEGLRRALDVVVKGSFDE